MHESSSSGDVSHLMSLIRHERCAFVSVSWCGRREREKEDERKREREKERKREREKERETLSFNPYRYFR